MSKKRERHPATNQRQIDSTQFGTTHEAPPGSKAARRRGTRMEERVRKKRERIAQREGGALWGEDRTNNITEGKFYGRD